MRLLSVYLGSMLIFCSWNCLACGQGPLLVEPPATTQARPPTPPTIGAEAWAEIIREVVIAAVPEKSVEDEHWGGTAKVFSRYEIKTKKGRISMRPLTSEVNHGFWQRYTVTMLKPTETLQIEFQNVQRLPDGQLTFTMQLMLRARVNSEFEHWIYGVKGLNGQVEADVTITAQTDCSFDLQALTEKGQLLPSLQLVPEVADLHLKVHDIDARKIGLIGGSAAEELGNNSRTSVNNVLNEFEGAILKSLRRKIEKQKDRLRIAPAKLLGG